MPVVRPGRPQHGPQRGKARAVDRVLVARSARQLLEDHRGVRAAAKAGDPSVAYDYYWGGRPVNGKTFGGFVSPQDAAFLGSFGLERTMQDWYEVLRTEEFRASAAAPTR